MLETLTFAFDFVLILASAITAVIASRVLGGHSSKGIVLACAGLITLGFVHLSETLLDVQFDFVGSGSPEMLHRGLIFGGFMLLGVGLTRIGSELRREINALQESNSALSIAHEDLQGTNEELRLRNSQLIDARVTAATDGLTGLQNHRSFHIDVRDAYDHVRDNGGTMALVMMDLDGFKSINDAHGHLMGDEVLRNVAAVIQLVCKDQKAYRYGGDEFAVIIADVGEQAAQVIAERLRTAVVSSIVANSQQVTVSIGVCDSPDSANTVEELIYRADTAMYWAKSLGKNRVARWSEISGDRERLVAAARSSQLIRVA
ncbi:MAG: GGDEF domain-containing protein [Chloroflexota bacterium]